MRSQTTIRVKSKVTKNNHVKSNGKEKFKHGELLIVQMQEKLSQRGKWRQTANGKSRKHPASMLQVTKSDKTT